MHIKLTHKGTMTFLSVKAFGRYFNASWGKSKAKRVAMPKAPQLDTNVVFTVPAFNYMGWTPEGFEKAMTCQAFKALDDAMWEITNDSWFCYLQDY